MNDDLVAAAEQALAKALGEVMTGRSINSTPGAAMLVAATAYALAITRGDNPPAPGFALSKSEHHSHGLFG